jgi:hypothetical protein
MSMEIVNGLVFSGSPALAFKNSTFNRSQQRLEQLKRLDRNPVTDACEKNVYAQLSNEHSTISETTANNN